MIIWWRWWW